MKAISLWQPWASLMAIGAKAIETRGRQIHYRGDLVICSTKNFPVELRRVAYHHEPFCSVLAKAHCIPTQRHGMTPENLPLGFALCVVEVFACYPTTAVSGSLSKQEVAIVGRQGFFNLPLDVEKNITAQLS